MPRQRLPNRRIAVSESFLWPLDSGRRVHLTVGIDRESQVREIFLRGGSQVGSERDLLLDDIAVLTSILLQHVYAPAFLRQRVGSLPNGSAASLIGLALDRAAAIERDLK